MNLLLSVALLGGFGDCGVACKLKARWSQVVTVQAVAGPSVPAPAAPAPLLAPARAGDFEVVCENGQCSVRQKQKRGIFGFLKKGK